NRPVSSVQELCKRFHSLLKIRAAGMAIDHYGLARRPSQQLIKRNIETFGFDVPESSIYGSNGAHGDRPTPPVSALVEVMPRVFDLASVTPDQQRNNVIGQIARNREFPPVECRVAETRNSVFCSHFQRDEIPNGAAYDHFGVDNFHFQSCFGKWKSKSTPERRNSTVRITDEC